MCVFVQQFQLSEAGEVGLTCFAIDSEKNNKLIHKENYLNSKLFYLLTRAFIFEIVINNQSLSLKSIV